MSACPTSDAQPHQVITQADGTEDGLRAMLNEAGDEFTYGVDAADQTGIDRVQRFFPMLDHRDGGDERTVFDLPTDYHPWDCEVVVKFANGERFTAVNFDEQQTWRCMEDTEYEPFFAPTKAVGPGGTWLVMEKVTPRAGWGASWRDLEAMFRDAGVNPWDLHHNNVGQKNDRTVVLDYPWGHCDPDPGHALE